MKQIGAETLGCLSGPEANPTARKALGIFYTNGICAELLAQLTIRDAHARTLDLACGDGILLAAAYRIKRSMLATSKRRIRSKLLEDLFGVDIVPSAARSAAIRLLIEAAPPKYCPLNIAVTDSTNLLPGKMLPTLNLDPAKTNSNWWEESEKIDCFSLEPADIALMNPPFTRQERLSKKLKRTLRKHFAPYGEYDDGRLGLYGYFVFLADMFVKKGGRIGLVLPASFLRLQSTRGLRRLLCDNYDIEYLVTAFGRSAFSESSSFREIMLVATKRKLIGETESLLSYERSSCLIVHLIQEPKTLEEARQVAERIVSLSRSDKNVYRNSSLFARKIPQAALNSALNNLFSVVSVADQRASETWLAIKSYGADKLTHFASYLQENDAEIWRGLETGSDICIQVQKAFILRSEARARGLRDEWILDVKQPNFLICRNRRDDKKIKIRSQSLALGLRRLSGLQYIDVSGETDWIYYKSFPTYFGSKRRQHTDQVRWRRYVNDRAGTLALARRFGVSRPGTRLLAFYCRHPVAPSGVMWSLKNLCPTDAKILALWFNSTPNLLQLLLNRVETSGPWMQLHEYVVKDLFVLDPRKLSNAQTKLLLETFKRLRRVAFPPLGNQFSSKFRARLALDDAVLRSFGLDKKSAARIGDQARLAFVFELQNLSRIDEGNKWHARVLRLEGIDR